MSAVPINYDLPQPKTKSAAAAVKSKRVEKFSRNVATALEHAVERGKLRPYEAVDAAHHFGIAIADWVRRQRDHHLRSNPTADH